MKDFLLIISFLCLSISTYAQSNIIVKGTVLDAKTNQPIPYAHVGIPEKGIGTTTAGNGKFILKVPKKYEKSTLIISFIGYDTYKKAIVDFQQRSLTIQLKTAATDLTEVVVLAESAIENIIRKAVKKIPKNYAKHPTKVMAFYRESRTDEAGKYIYLAEGVLNLYKKSYRSKKEGQVTLEEGRQVILVEPEEFAEKSNFSSGHMAGHRFDIVKNREDFLNEKYFEAYKYWIVGNTTYNNRPIYIIGFDQQDGHEDGRMKGKVFIDKKSYAIIRTEFEILPEGLKKWNDYPLYAGSWKGNSYIANYRMIGDRWYFSDAIREGLYRDGGVYTNEVLVTENNTNRGKPLPYKERLRRHGEFLDLTGSYDHDFWAAYNTVPLNEELEKNVENKTNKKSEEVFDLERMAAIQRQRDSIQTAKREKEIEERKAEGLSVPTDEMQVMKKVKRFRMRFQNSLSAGALYMPTGGDNYDISYLDVPTSSNILNINNDVRQQDFEYLLQYNLNVFLKKHLFFRFGRTWEFGTSIYKERSLGLGTQVNLSKGRPFFVRLGVDHSRLYYARRVGQFANDIGEFEADGETLNAEKINVYYGSRIHSVRGFFELSVEANPVLEIFMRGTYTQPFNQQQHIYLWERGDLFRKKVRLPLDEQIIVQRNSLPFDGSILPQNPIFLQVGVIFK